MHEEIKDTKEVSPAHRKTIITRIVLRGETIVVKLSFSTMFM